MVGHDRRDVGVGRPGHAGHCAGAARTPLRGACRRGRLLASGRSRGGRSAATDRMPHGADEPTPWERMTATSTGGRRFRRRPAQADRHDASRHLAQRPQLLPRRRARVQRGGRRSAASSTALRRKTPQLDVLVIDDGSTDATAAARRGGRARACCGCRSTSASAAPCRPASSTPTRTATTTWSRSTATASTIPREIAKLFAALEGPDRADMICGSRFATATGYIAPISRRTGIHLFAFLLSRLLRQPVTDPTSGFRLYNRRAIALFARDYPHDYPEVEAVLMLHHHRLTMREVPGADVPARRRRLLDRRLRQVLLLHGQGAARPVRRPRPAPRGAARRASPPPVAADHGI